MLKLSTYATKAMAAADGASSSQSVKSKLGAVKLGSPAGTWPTVGTAKPKSAAAPVAPTTTSMGPPRPKGWSSRPVSAVAARRATKSATRQVAPMARAVPFTSRNPAASSRTTPAGEGPTSRAMPANAGTWLSTMSRAAAFTNPVTTGWLKRFTMPASWSARNPHSTRPTCRQSTAVTARYASECAGAWAPTAAATIKAATATGPTTSCREEPSTA